MIDPIQRLRDLLATATPGPWCACTDGHLECREIAYVTTGIEIHSPSSPFMRGEPKADAALIVAAANALPALLDVVEAAQRLPAIVTTDAEGKYMMLARINAMMGDLREALAKLEGIK